MGKEFNDMILRNVEDFKTKTRQLKEQSGYYPKIAVVLEGYDENFGYRFAATTLLRKEFNDKWYTIHYVQRVSINKSKEAAEIEAKLLLLEKMMLEVYLGQLFYIVTGRFEDEDKLQITEEERLKTKLY